MTRHGVYKPSALGLLIAGLFSSACNRAPSFDILGAFFPAWLACLFLGLLLTVAVRWILWRARVVLAIPALSYPSLTALFTFAIWFTLFR